MTNSGYLSMNVSTIIERAKKSTLLRLMFVLFGAIATFLQFALAGLTWLFILLALLTLLVLVFTIAPLVQSLLQEFRVGWFKKDQPAYDFQRKIETLDVLIEEFGIVEKSKALENATTNNEPIKAVAILAMEGNIGVMLNVGQVQDVKVGTRLIVFRTDEFTTDGRRIEQPIALVQVTYVQAGNNCSQAKIIDRYDQDFWERSATRLRAERKIDPPSNFAKPFVPDELRSLSKENISTFRTYLMRIRNSLINHRAEPTAGEEETT